MALNPRMMLGLGGTRPSMQYQQLNPAFQSDPRRILGQALMQQGTSAAPVRTPLQGLGRLSSALVGAYLQRKAGDAQVERENEYRTQLTSALTGFGDGVPSGITALGQIPGMEIPAMNAALNYQTTVAANQAKKPKVLTTAEALAAGVPQAALDRGTLFQTGPSGLGAVSGTAAPTTGLNQARALDEIYNLATKDNRTADETQRLDFLNEFVKRPTIQNIPQADGTVITQKVPGFDAVAALTNNTVTQAPLDGSVTPTVTTEAVAKNQNILGVKPAKLTAPETKFVSQMASAQNDLQTVIDIMFNGDLQGGEYNQGVSIAAGSGLTQTLSGDSQRLYDAISNLVDLRLRDRTGATANESEIRAYREAVLPGLTTRPDTQRARILRLVTELNANVNVFKQGRNIPNLAPIALPNSETQSTAISVKIPGTD
tara:strand:- start:2558 stop:3844 length:1287 start_codon:yes stop_codon:yes gene_type:complete